MAVTATVYGSTVKLTGNPIRVKVSGETIPEGATFYKYLLKVISVNSDLVGAPFYDAIAPDASMEAYFDISGYCDQPVDMVFEHPAATKCKEYATRLIEMKVQPGVRYIDSDGVLQESYSSESTAFYVMKGGVSNRQLAMWNTDGLDFHAVYIDGLKFLTQRPSGDYVHPNQQVKLWYVPKTAYSATVYVKGYYDDGTTVTKTASASLTAWKLYEINCNPVLHGLTLEPTGTKMLSYDVWLMAGAGDISDVRNFTIDWKYCERPFYLMFANSLGGIDDVYLGGFATEKYQTESTAIQRPPQSTDTVYNATIMTPNKKGQNVFTINTGWKTATQMRHIRDMLVSRNVWLLYPNLAVSTYCVIPVNLSADPDVLVDYKEDLYACDLEITEAHKDQYVFDNRLY